MIFSIVSTTLMACSPTLVSALNITASAPSITAFATSLTSALVGVGFTIIDSIICVATITGFAAFMHFSMMFFCMIGKSCKGISTPKSPLATIMPSVTSMISSIFATASGFSILAITFDSFPAAAILAFKSTISSAFLTKDKPIHSMSFSNPNCKSMISFSVKLGNETSVCGKLKPFLDFRRPPVTTLASTSVAFKILSIFNSILPSSIRINSPGLTSLAKST